MTDITLVPLSQDDREQFIKDNQEAFNYGALEEFGLRDNHFEEEGEIISRDTIQQSIDSGEAYRIMQDDTPVGGVVIKVDGERGDLNLLFVSPKAHSKGIGYGAWLAVEALHPETKVWETCTPYFETRNIHFYVNKCGFCIVEFFIVVSGKGLIQQRRVGSDEVLNFEVSGEKIEAVHMLPGYTHNIINLSDTEDLVTVMWANEAFDPSKPDTYFEKVEK